MKKQMKAEPRPRSQMARNARGITNIIKQNGKLLETIHQEMLDLDHSKDVLEQLLTLHYKMESTHKTKVEEDLMFMVIRKLLERPEHKPMLTTLMREEAPSLKQISGVADQDHK